MVVIKIFLSLYLFWILYLAVDTLYLAKRAGTISRTALILGWPIYIFAGFVDVLMNFTLFSLIFFDIPRQFLVTQRLSKYQTEQPSTWRGKLAQFICSKLLDEFAAGGKHCK